MEEEKERKNWYDKSYKWLMLIPGIILLLSAVYLINFNVKNGDIIYKDVSITGGTSVTVFDENVDISDLENSLRGKFSDLRVRKLSEFRTGKQKGFFVESIASVEELKGALEEYLGYQLTQENSSSEFSGASLSEGF